MIPKQLNCVLPFLTESGWETLRQERLTARLSTTQSLIWLSSLPWLQTKQALDFIRKEGQPYLLEIDTYRFRGHSMGDPERYRKAEEVKKWQENDPIGIFNKQLLEKKVASTKVLDEIEARVEDEVAKAVEFAEASPEPAMEELFTDVYVEN